MAPDELVVVQFLQGKLVVDVVLFLVCNVAIPPTAKQLFPTSVFGSWLAGRPLFAAFSATLYLKPKHNPKKNGGIYEVSQAKRWVTCHEPVQRLRFASSTRRRRKTRQKEKQKKHFRPANLA